MIFLTVRRFLNQCFLFDYKSNFLGYELGVKNSSSKIADMGSKQDELDRFIYVYIDILAPFWLIQRKRRVHTQNAPSGSSDFSLSLKRFAKFPRLVIESRPENILITTGIGLMPVIR